MSKEIKIAGSISFGGKRLNVYGDLDAPLFKAKDISHAIGYSSGNEWRMLEMCEEDEKLKLPLVVAGQRRSVNFVTENGLYNILAQSRMEIARSWRRVVHDELINMRKEKGRNIAEQFEEWDHAMDNIYFDEETGQLMQSVTVPGGDVIQLLPSSYNQTRNVMMNYEVLANIYKSRKDHKLDEWRNFCKWIEELPYSELITGGKR